MIVILGVALTALMLAAVVWMLLTGRLREKYAVMWLLIGACVLVLGLVPQILESLATLLGVELPSNLLFALALVLLLGVALHLSWELSKTEDEIRRLAEESAIQRAELEELRRRLEGRHLHTDDSHEDGDA